MKIQTFDDYIRYDLFIDKDGNVYRKSVNVTEYDPRTDRVIETIIHPQPVDAPQGDFSHSKIRPRYVIYYRVQFDVPRKFGWTNEQIWNEAERQYKEGLANEASKVSP